MATQAHQMLDSRRESGNHRKLGDPRSEFSRDRDRLLHSLAFRKLAGKTQLFPVTWLGGVGRNRLVHSLETGQIAAYIALKHGGVAFANKAEDPARFADAVKAACFSHDLGHPPFGSAGALALDRCLIAARDAEASLPVPEGAPAVAVPVTRFSAEAQALRVARTIERRDHGTDHALDLTRTTLLASVKYPWGVRDGIGSPRGLYAEDASFVAEAYSEANCPWSIDELDAGWDDGTLLYGQGRTLAGQIVTWSDDLARTVHDFEDAVESGAMAPFFLEYASSRDAMNAMWAIVRDAPYPASIKEQYPDQPEIEAANMITNILDLVRSNLAARSALSGRTVNRYPDARRLMDTSAEVRQQTRTLIRSATNEWVRIEKSPHPDAVSTPWSHDLRIDRTARQATAMLKAIVLHKVSAEHRLLGYLAHGQRMVEAVFEVLMSAQRVVPWGGPDQLASPLLRGMLTLAGPQGDGAPDSGVVRARVVADYISGLTELELSQIAARITEVPTAIEPGYVAV